MTDRTELTIAEQEQNYIKEFISLKEALLATLNKASNQKRADEAEPTLKRIASYLLKVFFAPAREKFAPKIAAEIQSHSGFIVSITDASLVKLKLILQIIIKKDPETLEDLYNSKVSAIGSLNGTDCSISSEDIKKIGWYRDKFDKALSQGDAYFINEQSEETLPPQISELQDINKRLKIEKDSLKDQLKEFEQIKAENEKLKNDAKKLGPREKENMFATIGAMHEILIGETNRKSVFSSPEELMTFLCDNYDKRHEGFSRSTLFEKFKIAKKTINKNK